MSEEWLERRERALENEYFRRHDRELIASLREQGRLERERAELERELGIHDREFLAHLQEAGFSPSNLSLLHLVPVVEVAWAEGEVTGRERDLILALAERRGIVPGDPAHAQLVSWLETCPTREFFETTFEAIRRALATKDEAERDATRRDVVAWATRIAEATGGILGMRPISREERECLRRIASGLAGAHPTEGHGTAGHEPGDDDPGVTIV